jgi:hypothetical protein
VVTGAVGFWQLGVSYIPLTGRLGLLNGGRLAIQPDTLSRRLMHNHILVG